MEQLDSLMSDGQKMIFGAIAGAIFFSCGVYNYYGSEKRVSAKGENEFTRNPENYELLDRNKTTIRYRAKLKDRLMPAGIAGLIGAVAGTYVTRRFFISEPIEKNTSRRASHYGNQAYNVDRTKIRGQGKNLPTQQRRDQRR